MTSPKPHFLYTPEGDKIAYHTCNKRSTRPGIIFCAGFMSDMEGSKALALEDFAKRQGINFTRFDYHGHGQSAGRFDQGSISRWTKSALAILEKVTTGPQIIVGSSMGGWIGLRLALMRPTRVAAMVGIAAAPDFIDRLWWKQLSAQNRLQVMSKGYIDIPSEYGDQPYRFTRYLIQDGRTSRVLPYVKNIKCPVRLLQGMEDRDVPWQTALDLVQRLENCDSDLTLVPGGDHRLSRPHDLKRLTTTVSALISDIV